MNDHKQRLWTCILVRLTSQQSLNLTVHYKKIHKKSLFQLKNLSLVAALHFSA